MDTCHDMNYHYCVILEEESEIFNFNSWPYDFNDVLRVQYQQQKEILALGYIMNEIFLPAKNKYDIVDNFQPLDKKIEDVSAYIIDVQKVREIMQKKYWYLPGNSFFVCLFVYQFCIENLKIFFTPPPSKKKTSILCKYRHQPGRNLKAESRPLEKKWGGEGENEVAWS